jgi:cytochrome c553
MMMRKLLRWIGYVLAAIVLIALIFAAWVWFASGRVLSRTHEGRAERLAAPDAAQRADAGRQARIQGCTHCHGEQLEGRMMFDGQPFATVWAPNLSELAGRTSDQQLARAIRQGIGADGRALFIMPSDQYSRLSDEEVAALIAFIRATPRRGGPTPPIRWGPIGRFALAMGQMPPIMTRIEDYGIREPYDTGPGEAAGRRLAANTCSACHGPDLSGQPSPEGGPPAPDLAIAGAYDLAQFRMLMRTGVPPGGRDLGLMKEVAVHSLSHFNAEEVGQLHAYLAARAERVSR